MKASSVQGNSNAETPIETTDCGNVGNVNLEQPLNAQSPIV